MNAHSLTIKTAKTFQANEAMDVADVIVWQSSWDQDTSQLWSVSCAHHTVDEEKLHE